jgi:hypothetical protein
MAMMPMDYVEALMWATLERCGRSPEGYPLDTSHPLVAMLIEVGVAKPGTDGRVVLTEKGRAVLKARPQVPKSDDS